VRSLNSSVPFWLTRPPSAWCPRVLAALVRYSTPFRYPKGPFLFLARESVDSLGMNSRVHPKYKTRYRVTNWAEYDQSLVQRGNITVWITPRAIEDWAAKPRRRRGAPRK
jgi:hypothetical protein